MTSETSRLPAVGFSLYQKTHSNARPSRTRAASVDAEPGNGRARCDATMEMTPSEAKSVRLAKPCRDEPPPVLPLPSEYRSG